MHNLSFKFRVFIIFLVPAIAMLYLTFYFVGIKYDSLNNASSYKLFAEMTKITSSLIHNIQLERGLSTGYIVVKNKKLYKQKLLKQQELSDEAYKRFMQYYDLQKEDKNGINQLILLKNESKIKKFLQKWYFLKEVRDSVLNSSIDFEKTVRYYSYLNSELMKTIYTLTTILVDDDTDPNGIYRLEELKEYAGLERAYIYNQLLSKNITDTKLLEIKSLINKEEEFKKEFLANSSVLYLKLYNKIIDEKLEKNVKYERNLFFKGKLDAKDAKRWFDIDTKRINNFEELSIVILDSYIKSMDIIAYKSKIFLLITLFLWLFSIMSFLLLAYILNKLIDKEARLMEDLRISAYAFDAHEAMTITDPNGIILKVNKAFTYITGYSPSEVIGKNPRILKSYKHSDEFYKNMWLDLHTKGRWSDEIYNRRKNGEIYMEKLSITAIKDNNDITTHYIAQFLDISDLKEAQEKALHQANHDFLTNLPNRKSMMTKLREEFVRAKRHNILNTFLFIDLDGFKSVNDKYGHIIGDKLLQDVSKRFIKCIREEDYLARIGGDEFCIILMEIHDEKEDVKIISEKILLSLSEPFFIGGHKIHIGASIGIKIFPDDTNDINDVINKADMAMYKAKEQGKNQFVSFSQIIK